MAIKKTMLLTSNLGDQVEVDVYVRIMEIRATKGQGVAQFNVMKADKSRTIETWDVVFAPDVSEEAPPMWSQAYDAIKALPEFHDAVDC